MSEETEFDMDDLDDLDGQGDSGSAAASAQRGAESSTIKQMRRELNRAVREAKAAEQELNELRAFRTEREAAEREQQLGQVFNELQLDTKLSKLFVASNPDAEVSKEAVAQWALEYGLATQDGGEVERQVATEAFTPIAGTDRSQDRLPLQKVSRSEWIQMASNPATAAEAERLFKAGRVDLSDIEGMRPQI